MAEVVRQLEAAHQEAESAAAARHEAEEARRERDSAIESSKRGWLAFKDTEAAWNCAQEEATRTALHVTELEATLSH